MFIALLMAGLWVAVNPESVLRALAALGPALERFADTLRGLSTPYCYPVRRPEPRAESRGTVWAMRLFGIAFAALAFAGMMGFGR